MQRALLKKARADGAHLHGLEIRKLGGAGLGGTIFSGEATLLRDL